MLSSRAVQQDSNYFENFLSGAFKIIRFHRSIIPTRVDVFRGALNSTLRQRRSQNRVISFKSYRALSDNLRRRALCTSCPSLLGSTAKSTLANLAGTTELSSVRACTRSFARLFVGSQGYIYIYGKIYEKFASLRYKDGVTHVAVSVLFCFWPLDGAVRILETFIRQFLTNVRI